MSFKIDVFLMGEMCHFVVELEGFDGHEEFRYDIRVGTVSRKYKELHDELYFLECL